MDSNSDMRPRNRITFLVRGRAIELPDPGDDGLPLKDRRPTPQVVDRLQRSAVDIASEIELALHEATGDQYSVQLSFHRGSIEVQAVVSTLATAEVIQAAANLGGAIALAQTIASVVGAVVGRHLPHWMSKPMLSAEPVGVAAPPNPPSPPQVPVQSIPVQYRSTGEEHELRAIKWGVFGILVCAAATTAKYLFSAA